MAQKTFGIGTEGDWVRRTRVFCARKVVTVAVLCGLLCLPATVCGQAGAWSWTSGDKTGSSWGGVYGLPGVEAPENVPPYRDSAGTWVDKSGHLWLMGGSRAGTKPERGGYGDDLWRFNPSTGMWALMSGSSRTDRPGVYGTLGSAGADNTPGARTEMFTWADADGLLWLLGGTNSRGACMNDLWKFDPATRQWAWMGGSKTVSDSGSCGQPGVYGTRGTAAAGNVPGGRLAGNSWVDSSGNFWLFGGYGLDGAGIFGDLNDLWMFDRASQEWIWVSGSSSSSASGTYGALGQAAAGNSPGARGKATSWVDSSGILYLFGGEGIDSAGNFGMLNDLWKFDPKTRYWTWISGSNVLNPSDPGSGYAPVYGKLGDPAAENHPGSRQQAVGWADRSGDIWLFGGATNSNSGPQAANIFDDLWEFNPATSQWTWWGGNTTLTCLLAGGTDGCLAQGATGVYGSLGLIAAENTPGSRYGAMAWLDQNGDAWLFGGLGFDSTGLYTDTNDLWHFQFKRQPSVQLASSASAVFQKNTITLSATVSGGSGTPSGSVTFFEGGTALGSGALDGSGVARLSLDDLAVGLHQITANYSGDLLDLSVTSGDLKQWVEDFSLVPASAGTTAGPGSVASLAFAVAPVTPATTLPSALTLTAAGGPPGATYSFTPATVAAGDSTTTVTLNVTVPKGADLASASHPELRERKGEPLWLCWLMLPLAWRLGTKNRRKAFWPVLVPLLAGSAVILCLSGCSSFTWVSHSQTYAITVTAQSGAMSHSSTVTLTVQSPKP